MAHEGCVEVLALGLERASPARPFLSGASLVPSRRCVLQFTITTGAPWLQQAIVDALRFHCVFSANRLVGVRQIAAAGLVRAVPSPTKLLAVLEFAILTQLVEQKPQPVCLLFRQKLLSVPLHQCLQRQLPSHPRAPLR